MSNYTKTKDFAAADALATGNAAKAIKGVDLGLEFDNIATAVATKLNSGGNETLASLFMTGATGSGLGAGTINATGLYVNGVNLGTTPTPVVGSGTAPVSAVGLAVGQSVTVTRSASLSKTTNIVPAIDPVLQVTNIPVGTYKLAVVAGFLASGGGPGCQAGFAASAGTITPGGTFIGSQIYASVGTGQQNSSAASNSMVTDTSAAANYTVTMNGVMQISVIATVGLYWSQGVSSASATVLEPGSSLTLTRIA